MHDILHDWGDWDDSSSITILKNIKAVAKPGAQLAVVEHVLGASGASMERPMAMMDINDGLVRGRRQGARGARVRGALCRRWHHGAGDARAERGILFIVEVAL